MTYSAKAIRATIEFARKTGLVEVPTRIVTLDQRVESHATAIAVVGMIKRGKSTLFNRLIGDEVSAVSATPETVATIRVQSGPPSASGRTADGKMIELPSTPTEFMARLRRELDNRVVSASISGKFRLPDGLMLIDTPGVGDTAAVIDDQLSGLDEQWIEAGAGAALVVLHTFPDARDRALLSMAREAFPGAVGVVMKPISNDFEPSDLEATARYYSEEWKTEILPIHDVVPTAGWGGNSEFAALESLIVDLDRRAGARLHGDFERFKEFLNLLTAELEISKPVDLPSLRSGVSIRSLPDPLKSDCQLAINRLEKLQRDAEEAEAKKQRKIAESEADRRATSLIGLYRNLPSDDWRERLHLIEQICECAETGSSVAIKFQQTALKTRSDWPDLQEDRTRFILIAVRGIPDSALESTVKNAALSFNEHKVLLSRNLRPELQNAIEKSVVTKVGKQSALELRDLARLMKDPAQRRRIEEMRVAAVRNEKIREVRSQIDALKPASNETTFPVAARSINRAADGISKLLDSELVLTATEREGLRNEADKAVAKAWNSIGLRLIAAYKSWFEKWHGDVSEASASLQVLVQASEVIASHMSDNTHEQILRNYVAYAQENGKSWVVGNQQRAESAQKRAQERLQSLKMTYLGVCAAMVAMAALAYFSPWWLLGSILAGVAITQVPKGQSVQSWQSAFIPMTIPSEVFLGVFRPSPPKVPVEDQQVPDSRGCATTVAVALAIVVGLLALYQGMLDREYSSYEVQQDLQSEFESVPAPPLTTIVITPSSSLAPPSTPAPMRDPLAAYDVINDETIPIRTGEWIAILASIDASLPMSRIESDAASIIIEFEVRGYPEVRGVLLSSNFPGLRPGYVVVFAGPYSSSENASSFCRSAALTIPDECYPRLPIP